MKINYSITFLSDWHAGSGLGTGADADTVVIKDANHLPYLPGKTIKGLLKDVLIDIQELQPNIVSMELINKYFGFETKEKETHTGSLFFSNAELPDKERTEMTEELVPFLYRNIASTRIEDNGIAQVGSLRTMEVCIPLSIEGFVEGVETADKTVFEYAFKMLRHLGSNRNRGLGRCSIKIKN